MTEPHTEATLRADRTMQRVMRGIILANVPGAAFCTVYFTFLDQPELKPAVDGTLVVAVIMTLLLVVIGIQWGKAWSKDLREAESNVALGRPIAPALRPLIHRKLLNSPMVNTTITLSNWTAAAVIMSVYFYWSAQSTDLADKALSEALRLAFGIFISGIVVGVLVYFVSDGYMRQLRPRFFPDGSLARAERGFRLTVRRRLFLVFMVVSIGPMAVVTVILYHKLTTTLPVEARSALLGVYLALAFVMVIMALVCVLLSRLVAASIAGPIREMEAAMEEVRQGDLSVTVPVRDADELGVLADSFNEMTEGLRERRRMQHSLDLARQVQQSLLPGEAPVVPGLDAAGASIYCDETGGDYYDYIRPGNSNHRLAVVVGDVSDHGLPSALLMTTARAFIRQGLNHSSDAARVAAEVNRLLVGDVGDSGQFMTLFLAVLDPVKKEMNCVSAGHDPALVYDPASDSFGEIALRGPALGLVEDVDYPESRQDLRAGQILVIGTDGIWEARDVRGRMFGKDSLRRVVHEHRDDTAREIVRAVVDELHDHAAGCNLQDDVTIVVVKILE